MHAQLLKKHALNPAFTLFVSISCSKGPVPKICNINFWLKMPRSPFWNFSKNSSDLVTGPFPSYSTIVNLLESNTKVRNCFRDTEPRKPGGQLERSIEYSFFLCVSKPRIFAQNCWQDHAPYSQDLTGPVSNLSQNRRFWTQTSSNSYFAVTVTVLQILDQPPWLFSFHTKMSVCFCCWSACAWDLTISCFLYCINMTGL